MSGAGRRRALHYSLSDGGSGLSVTFAEQAGRVYRVLGTARRPRGTITFAPADGPRGRRTIVALISVYGQPKARRAIARYTAPGPVIPGRVRGLHIRQRRGEFIIAFGGTRSASHYVMRIDATDGRHLQRIVGPHGHLVRVRALGYFDHIHVAVAGISPAGRTGPAARAHT